MVAQDLEFDMSGLHEVAFEEDAGVAEGLEGDTASRFQRGLEFRGLANDLHALAAAACSGFEDDREADCGCSLGQGIEVFARALVTGDHRDPVGCHGLARGDLVAHQFDGSAGRSDEGQTGLFATAGKRRVLGEEAIAGMEGIRALGGGRG